MPSLKWKNDDIFTGYKVWAISLIGFDISFYLQLGYSQKNYDWVKTDSTLWEQKGEKNG